MGRLKTEYFNAFKSFEVSGFEMLFFVERRLNMYLTVKQELKHLAKDEYLSLRKLSHIAKNLTNEAIYNVRQYYFKEEKYLKYADNYKLLKTSVNYRLLNSNMSQQILKEVDGSFKAFFGLITSI